MSHIYHLLRWRDWPAGGACDYAPASLQTEGFIHCSSAEQVAGAATRYYAGVADLMILALEISALTSPLVWENTTGGTEPFPHLYGPINAEAVRDLRPFMDHPE